MRRRALLASTLTFAAAAAGTTRPAHAQSPPLDAAAVQALIRAAAQRHGVDADLALSVAHCESRYGQHWRTNAPENPCRGVYQLNAITWTEQAPRYGLPASFEAAYDPALNVELAVCLLAAGESWRWRACLL